jgi:hypothetical protein
LFEELETDRIKVYMAVVTGGIGIGVAMKAISFVSDPECLLMFSYVVIANHSRVSELCYEREIAQRQGTCSI